MGRPKIQRVRDDDGHTWEKRRADPRLRHKAPGTTTYHREGSVGVACHSDSSTTFKLSLSNDSSTRRRRRRRRLRGRRLRGRRRRRLTLVGGVGFEWHNNQQQRIDAPSSSSMVDVLCVALLGWKMAGKACERERKRTMRSPITWIFVSDVSCWRFKFSPLTKS